MVDNGDWEGFMIVATKFKANQDDHKYASSENIIQKANTLSSGKRYTDLSMLSNSTSSLNSKNVESCSDCVSRALRNSQNKLKFNLRHRHW